MGIARRIIESVVGREITLPDELIYKYPELGDARFRRGGIPLNVGGWLLGSRSVSGVTLWRTIFLHPREPLDPALLLHELRHVHQFRERRSFPIRYLLQSVIRGYRANPYEVDAREYAERQMRTSEVPPDSGGGV